MKEVAVRKTRILWLIIIGSFVGVGLAVTWYIRQPPVAALRDDKHQPIAGKAHVYPLPDDLLSALRSASGFQVRHTVADVPPLVRSAFAQATHQEFSMAEPGDKWQSTDVIIGPGLPWRRLTAVAVSAKFCLVFYERGGIGKSNIVAVFRLSPRGAEPVWLAHPDDSVADPTSLAVAIDEKKIYVGATSF